MTQLVVALGLSWESQKSTTTLRPASPPLALRPAAHAWTAVTESLNSPGTRGLLTSAMMPTLMVVAVSPMSVPGPADPAGEAAWLPAAAAGAGDEAAAEVAADAGALLVLLLEALQPAASRTAASAATTVRKRARAGNGRLARLSAPPGLSLLAVTLVPSTTSLPVSLTLRYPRAHD